MPRININVFENDPDDGFDAVEELTFETLGDDEQEEEITLEALLSDVSTDLPNRNRATFLANGKKPIVVQVP